MRKPGSKSLSRKGKQSEGPEHKAKTAVAKFSGSIPYNDPPKSLGTPISVLAVSFCSYFETFVSKSN